MPSELRKGVVRIVTNYLRLFTTVILGLILVPMLLRSLTEDGFSVVSLFGSTVGLAAMFNEIIRSSMIRELGTAYHGGDWEHFRRSYSTSFLISAVAACAAGVIFALLWYYIDVFQLQGLRDAARGLIVAKGVETFITILTAPTFNMLLVSERMGAYNFWLFMTIRGAEFISAVLVSYVIVFDLPGHALIAYATLSSGMAIAATLVGCTHMIIADRRTMPSVRRVDQSCLKPFIRLGGWNAIVVTAMNLHLRLSAVIMNLVFGLFGNLIFGIAVQFTSYARRLTIGVTDGLDAVAARVSSKDPDDDTSIHRLLVQSTRMHAFVTFPAVIVIVLLTEPLLQLWIGRRVEDPAVSIPPTVMLIQVLSIGMAVRSIADGWARILYGAGHIRAYAPIFLLGGIASPVLAFVLIWAFQGDWWEWSGPAWAFSIIMLLIHGVWFPRIVARSLGMTIKAVIGPAVPSALVAICCAPVILGIAAIEKSWSIQWILVALAAFGAAYGIGSYMFVLGAEDRELLTRAFSRRVRRPRANSSN